MTSHTVETQDFGENEDKDLLKTSVLMHKDKTNETHHADEEPRLLRGTPYTGVSNDTNSEPGSKTSETDREASTELDKALEQRHLHRHCASMSIGIHICK